jgi:thymidylate kinase
MICSLIAAVFDEFAQANISYCLLRGYEALLSGAIDGDVDLLIAPSQFDQAREILQRLGFVALVRWGQTPHSFFIGYDEHSDGWIKLDIVHALTYGRPIPTLHTALATECLDNRVRRGPLFVLVAEDELLTLLLHCLLDKGTFEPAYCSRLATLAREISGNPYITAQVSRYFPPNLTWDRLRQMLIDGEWDTLLKMRGALVAQLARRDPVGTRWRRAVTPALRFLDRRTRAMRGRGLSMALLAPDGAGKTTLARSLGQTFYLPTRYVYMGTNLDSSTITLPTTRWLQKASRGKGRPLIRMLHALNTVLEQGLRYRVAAYHRRRGRLVVFDRYPDGVLALKQSGGALHKRLRRQLMRMLCPPPDMVVYLDAPAEVLYERKHEHSPGLLEQQRQRYLQLLQGVPQTVIVDVQREPDQIRREVSALVWRRYAVSMSGE